jgi:hypothetical protein
MKVKKLTLLGAGILLVALFTSCMSPKIINFDYKERALEGTPENSVIFIGFYGNNLQMYWSQCDSEYPPDYQKLEGPYIVSAPVAPGSRYRLAFDYGEIRSSYSVTYWGSQKYMQENQYDIKIPDEPGIYYFGYNSGADTWRYQKPMPMVGLFATKDPAKQEIECLEAALRLYKKTAWEPVIQERIKELRK